MRSKTSYAAVTRSTSDAFIIWGKRKKHIKENNEAPMHIRWRRIKNFSDRLEWEKDIHKRRKSVALETWKGEQLPSSNSENPSALIIAEKEKKRWANCDYIRAWVALDVPLLPKENL